MNNMEYEDPWTARFVSCWHAPAQATPAETLKVCVGLCVPPRLLASPQRPPSTPHPPPPTPGLPPLLALRQHLKLQLHLLLHQPPSPPPSGITLRTLPHPSCCRRARSLPSGPPTAPRCLKSASCAKSTTTQTKAACCQRSRAASTSAAARCARPLRACATCRWAGYGPAPGGWRHRRVIDITAGAVLLNTCITAPMLHHVMGNLWLQLQAVLLL